MAWLGIVGLCLLVVLIISLAPRSYTQDCVLEILKQGPCSGASDIADRFDIRISLLDLGDHLGALQKRGKIARTAFGTYHLIRR